MFASQLDMRRKREKRIGKLRLCDVNPPMRVSALDIQSVRVWTWEKHMSSWLDTVYAGIGTRGDPLPSGHL